MCKWRQNCHFLGVEEGLSLPCAEFIHVYKKNWFALLSVIYNFQIKIAPVESESDNQKHVL